MPYLTYKYRLYPNATQVVALEQQLETLRNVYNAALAWWRDAYQYEKAGRGNIIPRKAKKGGGERKSGLVESLYPILSALRNGQVAEQKAGQPGQHWFAQVAASAMLGTLQRVQTAFENFIRRRSDGAKAGLPRFKAYRGLRSIPFNQFNSGCSLRSATGKRVDGDSGPGLRGYRVQVFGVGAVKLKLHRPLVGRIKTVAIKQDVDDKWYAVFACEQSETTVTPKVGPAVGVDLGLEHFLTTSDGEHVPNPRFLKLSLSRLRLLQRGACRKLAAARKAGRRLRECRNLQKHYRRMALLHVRVRNQRKEHRREVAGRLIDRYATVCVESLNVLGMIRNRKLSRAIGDAGWAGFVTTLKLKAAKAGVRMIEVDPSGTSQTCPTCGANASKEWKQRKHECPCGCRLHRDHAAALVILARGTNGAGSVPARHNVAPLPEANASGKGKRAGRSCPIGQQVTCRVSRARRATATAQ